MPEDQQAIQPDVGHNTFLFIGAFAMGAKIDWQASPLARQLNERCPRSAARSCFEDENGVELGADE